MKTPNRNVTSRTAGAEGMRVRSGICAGVIGRPATPMSYAGVARRTTRRHVYY